MTLNPMCATCAHYCQHYTEPSPGLFRAINCGHCKYPRLKMRRPHNVCDHYTPNEEVQHELYYPKGFGYAIRGKEET